MASIELLRSAISASLSDSHFTAIAARLTDSPLRRAVADQLAQSGLDLVVIAASELGDEAPYGAAEIVWQVVEGGEFQRQTIWWKLPGWAYGQERAQIRA